MKSRSRWSGAYFAVQGAAWMVAKVGLVFVTAFAVACGGTVSGAVGGKSDEAVPDRPLSQTGDDGSPTESPNDDTDMAHADGTNDGTSGAGDVDDGSASEDPGDFTPTTRDKLKWPFASDSPWNMPIGSNAVYVDGNFEVPAQYVHEDELVIVSPGAPMRTLWNNDGWWPDTACNASGNNRGQFPVPDGYVVPAPINGELPNRCGGVLEADGRTIVEFQYATRCSGTGPLTAGAYRCSHDIYGSGVSCFGAHGASGLSAVGGDLRAWEITDTGPIRHALKVTTSVRALSNCNNGYRWPATATDAGYDQPDNVNYYSGTVCDLRMGSLVALEPSEDCEALVQSTLGRRICHAFQDYGAYVVDTGPNVGGWRPFSINNEVGAADATYAIQGEILALVPRLAVIANNDAAHVGGGGTPRVPLAPPLE